MIKMLLKGSVQTLYVSIISSVVAYLIGLPLGILLVTTEKDGLTPVTWLNKFLGVIINLLRSVPFLILVLVVQPFTRLIIGTPLGPKASIVPLVIASAPYIARLVESSIKEIDRGAIEAAQSMGASPFQIIYKVMLPEAKPSLIVGSAIAVTTIVGYSAMTGIVGGGGLGAPCNNRTDYSGSRHEDGKKHGQKDPVNIDPAFSNRESIKLKLK